MRIACAAPRFNSTSPLIAGAAALVTAASYAIDASEPILFGILDCIAVASLIAALFVAAPPWAALAARRDGDRRRRSPIPSDGVQPPPVPSGSASREHAAPATLDWRPLLPWAGVVLVGLGVTQAAARCLSQLAVEAAPRCDARLTGRAHSPSPAATASSSYEATSRSCSACCANSPPRPGLEERHARDAYLAACPPAWSPMAATPPSAPKPAPASPTAPERKACRSARRAPTAAANAEAPRDVVETCSLEAR